MIRFSTLDRQIFNLAIPAMGALAAEPLVSLVDTAFVGRLGADELAALGVVTAVFGFAHFLVFSLSFAITPLVARAVGAEDRRQAEGLVYHSLLVAVVLGAIGLAVLLGAAPQLVRLMGASTGIEPLAVDYLRIRGLALPGLMFITVGHGVYRGVGDTRTPLLVTLAASLANLVLDPVMIFWWGWGMNGAAIASVLAQWGAAVAFLILLLTGRTGLRVVRAGSSLGGLRLLLGAGSALTLRTFTLVATFTLAAASAARLGVLEIAAYQVSIQIFLFLALVMDSMAIAAQSLVATYLGSEDRRSARLLANRMLMWGFYWGILLGGAIWFLRPWLPGWFTSDPEVIATVGTMLPFVALLQPLSSLVFVFDGILIGAGVFRFLALAMVGACVPTAFLLIIAPSLSVLWWAIVFMMAARLVPMVWRYRSEV